MHFSPDARKIYFYLAPSSGGDIKSPIKEFQGTQRSIDDKVDGQPLEGFP